MLPYSLKKTEGRMLELLAELAAIESGEEPHCVDDGPESNDDGGDDIMAVEGVYRRLQAEGAIRPA